MVSPFDADLLAMRSQNRRLDSADPILNTIGQRFWMAISEELQLRGFAAERMAIQATTATEQLPGTESRTRVELDVVAQIPNATQSQLIDVLSRAKQKCANFAGPRVKIVLKAELKRVGDGYLAEPVVGN